MIVVENATLEQWTPDFSSSEQQSPRWFRLRFGGSELSNALNWIDWSGNPVQVLLCEACGHEQCETGGYVHCSRVGDTVLWSTTQIENPEDWQEVQFESGYAVRKHGAVAIPRSEWDAWRKQVPKLPPVDRFNEANGRALADAWRMSAQGPMRGADDLGAVKTVLTERCLSGTTLDAAELVRHVERAMTWLTSVRSETVPGTFQAASRIGARVETAYCDGPAEWDWPLVALREQEVFLAFGDDLVFVPADSTL